MPNRNGYVAICTKTMNWMEWKWYEISKIMNIHTGQSIKEYTKWNRNENQFSKKEEKKTRAVKAKQPSVQLLIKLAMCIFIIRYSIYFVSNHWQLIVPKRNKPIFEFFFLFCLNIFFFPLRFFDFNRMGKFQFDSIKIGLREIMYVELEWIWLWRGKDWDWGRFFLKIISKLNIFFLFGWCKHIKWFDAHIFRYAGNNQWLLIISHAKRWISENERNYFLLFLISTGKQYKSFFTSRKWKMKIIQN